MVVVFLIVLVSLYFFGVFCIYLFWLDVYFVGRVISEFNGFEIWLIFVLFNVNLVIFFDICCYMVICYIGFYKLLIVYFVVRVK